MAPRKPITLDANGAFSELSASDILEITPSASSSTPAIVPVGVIDSGVVVSDTAVGLVLGGTLVFSGLEFGSNQFLTFIGTSAVFSFSNVISMSAGGGDARFDLGPSSANLQHGNGAQVNISANTSGPSRLEFDSQGGGSIGFETPSIKPNITFTMMGVDGSNGDPIITDGSGVLSFEPKGGTSFPLTGLYAGREFWRTDLARSFRYDGTEWLGPMFVLIQGRNSQTNLNGFQTLRLAGNVIPANSGGYPMPTNMKLLRVQMFSNQTADPLSGTFTVRVNNVILYTRVLVSENSVDEDGLDIDLPASTVGGFRALLNKTGGTINDWTVLMWICERRTT